MYKNAEDIHLFYHQRYINNHITINIYLYILKTKRKEKINERQVKENFACKFRLKGSCTHNKHTHTHICDRKEKQEKEVQHTVLKPIIYSH